MTADSDLLLRAWSSFLSAHALAVRAVEERLKGAGAPPLGWYDVLLELDRAGGTLRVGDLAGRAVIEPYNMTRLLDRLEKEGLIRRERSPDDRRSVVAVLTPEGAALRRRTWPAYQRAILEVLRPLAGKDADALARALRAVVAGLRGDHPGGR